MRKSKKLAIQKQPNHPHVARQSAETTDNTDGLLDSGTTEIKRAIARPAAATPDTLLLIQQRYGNRTVQRMLHKQPANPATIQRGLFKNFNLFNAKEEKEEKVAPSNVKDIFKSDIYDYFKKYCKRTFNNDGIEFSEAYFEYKKNSSFESAREIYSEFIDPKGVLALNLQGGKAGSKSRKQIANEIASYLVPLKFSKEGGEMFDLAFELVTTDLAVPYGDFLNNSKEFTEWEKD